MDDDGCPSANTPPTIRSFFFHHGDDHSPMIFHGLATEKSQLIAGITIIGITNMITIINQRGKRGKWSYLERQGLWYFDIDDV